VINLEECILEDGPENKENGADDPKAKASKGAKANGTAEKEDPTASLIFRVSHKVAYKTVLKGIASHFEQKMTLSGLLVLLTNLDCGSVRRHYVLLNLVDSNRVRKIADTFDVLFET
jgi:hypothetical protein